MNLITFTAMLCLLDGGSESFTFLTAAPRTDPHRADTPELELRALVERTNDLKSFVADYRFDRGGGAMMQMRLCYQAPDLASVEITGGGHVIRTTLNDGMVTFLGTSEAKTTYAQVPVEEQLRAAWDCEAERLIRQELPSPIAETDHLAVSFGFQLNPNGEVLDCDFQLAYAFGGTPLLGWLDTAASWGAQSVESGFLRFSPSNGLSIALSAETGFIEEVHYQTPSGGMKSIDLESLAIGETVLKREFEPPVRSDGVPDSSAEFAKAQQARIREQTRLHALRAVTRAAKQKGELDEDLRDRLSRVLVAYYSPVLLTMFKSSIETSQRNIDTFIAWYRERWQATANDARAREELEVARATRHEQIHDSISKAAGKYADGVQPVPVGKIPSDYHDDFLRVEQGAVRLAAETVLLSPLLERLDKGIEEAKAGR